MDSLEVRKAVEEFFSAGREVADRIDRAILDRQTKVTSYEDFAPEGDAYYDLRVSESYYQVAEEHYRRYTTGAGSNNQNVTISQQAMLVMSKILMSEKVTWGWVVVPTNLNPDVLAKWISGELLSGMRRNGISRSIPVASQSLVDLGHGTEKNAVISRRGVTACTVFMNPYRADSDPAVHDDNIARRFEGFSIDVYSGTEAEGLEKVCYRSIAFTTWGGVVLERAVDELLGAMTELAERTGAPHRVEVYTLAGFARNPGSSRTKPEFERSFINIDHLEKDIPDCHYPYLTSLGTDDEAAVSYNDVIEKYAEPGSAPVMVFYGTPGSGKSTLVKKIIAACAKVMRLKSWTPCWNVPYVDALERRYVDKYTIVVVPAGTVTAPEEVLGLLSAATPTLFVFEDSDTMLLSRERHGNELMSHILNVTDGVEPCRHKLLFTANLTSISKIDEALQRPGRCHAIMGFKSMTAEQAAVVRDYHGIPQPEVPKGGSLAEILRERVTNLKVYRMGHMT